MQEDAPLVVSFDEDDAAEIYEAGNELNAVELIIEDPAWHTHLDEGVIDQCLSAALKALECVPPQAVREMEDTAPHIKPQLAVLMFSNDQTVHELNKTYRGKDKPTNILSFPNTQYASEMDDDDHIGDCILALETITREAQEQSKSLSDHLTHLVIHGVLHLKGYDHETEAEACEMETLEKDLLSSFEIHNPYAPC